LTLPAVKVENLSYRYPSSQAPALKGVNLEIGRGETVLIAGRSGCGKTTLARCLNGLIPHFHGGEISGKILVNGANPLTLPVWKTASSVGMIFQNPESQIFTLVVEDEVAFGPENLALPRTEISKRVDWAIAAVGLSRLKKKHVFELSDGQKQRLAVASALSCLPDILIFDEATSNLDKKAREDFLVLLTELKRRWGKTIILIDHRVSGLENVVDRVVLMENGSIAASGGRSILSDDRIVRKFGLRGCVFEGNPVFSPPKSAGEEIIEARSASFGYAGGFALNNVNFSIYRGESVAITGGNGSGKTTLLKLIAGLLKPGAGSIRLLERDTRKGRWNELSRVASVVLQNPDRQIFMNSVYEEVAFSRRIADPGKPSEEMVEKILFRMGISEIKNRHPHSLSQGEKQRVTVASAIAKRPDVLLLDEPTSGMDGYHLGLLIESLLKN